MFLSSIAKWFRSPSRRPNVRRAPMTRLQVEGLELRDVPAFVGGPAIGMPSLDAALVGPMTAPQSLSPGQEPADPGLHAALFAPLAAPKSQTLGQKMADYLSGKLNTRLGGGECSHLATEALRFVGADFTRTEPAGTTDYVWTSNRIAKLTSGSQVAGKKFKVGDIIQYENATFSSGGTSKLKHHTQVVAAVNANGRITKVYEQNLNGKRTVQLNAATDLTKLNGGSVSIYRPVARTTQSGRVEFTIVNNTSSSRTYTLLIGSSTSSKTLDKANTVGSYQVRYATFSGSAKPTLKIGNSSVQIQDGKAYEVYMSNGQVGIRKI